MTAQHMARFLQFQASWTSVCAVGSSEEGAGWDEGREDCEKMTKKFDKEGCESKMQNQFILHVPTG